MWCSMKSYGEQRRGTNGVGNGCVFEVCMFLSKIRESLLKKLRQGVGGKKAYQCS